ncbi:hypothetical protein AWC38_SpisGene21799 [Stylophora pistillata]|uniref:Uncharacterized protein n=1 Tax=Stylophora pistillata TaxID=50429 RepID=A0A2B4RA91_STYPI|nr:hypothetical protein AWC38_SpisGene21799 [Stylophora pistillata]
MWGMLSILGPDFCYPPNDKNYWIIAKPDKKESVKEVFKETSIKITLGWKKNLGAATGLREYLDEHFSDKVSDWVSKVAQLAESPQTQLKEFCDADELSKYSLHVRMWLDYAVICKREGFFIQRHDDPRDLVAELLSAVYVDGEVDPFLQDISEEQLIRGADKP